MIVSVSSDGVFAINKQIVQGRGVAALATAMAETAKTAKTANESEGKEPIVIISADAQATHQSVISVMEAARQTGLSQITFATQRAAGAN